MSEIRRPAYGLDGFPVIPTAEQYFQRFCSQQLQKIGLSLALLKHFDFSSQKTAQQSLTLCLATLDETTHLIAGTQSRATRDEMPF